MKYVVNWIPLRICVRSRNTQPHLNVVYSSCWSYSLINTLYFKKKFGGCHTINILSLANDHWTAIVAPLRVSRLAVPHLALMLTTRRPMHARMSSLQTAMPMYASTVMTDDNDDEADDSGFRWQSRRNPRRFIHGHAFSQPWSRFWRRRLQRRPRSHLPSLPPLPPPSSPLLLLLLLLGSPSEIQKFSLSASYFSPTGGCLVIIYLSVLLLLLLLSPKRYSSTILISISTCPSSIASFEVIESTMTIIHSLFFKML